MPGAVPVLGITPSDRDARRRSPLPAPAGGGVREDGRLTQFWADRYTLLSRQAVLRPAVVFTTGSGDVAGPQAEEP